MTTYPDWRAMWDKRPWRPTTDDIDVLLGEIDRHTAERDDLRRQLDAAQPVVETAVAWWEQPEGTSVDEADDALIGAVRDYLARRAALGTPTEDGDQ